MVRVNLEVGGRLVGVRLGAVLPERGEIRELVELAATWLCYPTLLLDMINREAYEPDPSTGRLHDPLGPKRKAFGHVPATSRNRDRADQLTPADEVVVEYRIAEQFLEAGSSNARCRCRPTYRGRRWDSSTQGMVWSATFGDRAEVLRWLASTIKGQEAVAEADAAGPTFAELATERLDGVHSGAVGRRRGRKGTGYSSTTLEGYERSLRYVLTPEFGARHASEIDDREWRTWVDRLSREGLSRSRIANHLAVARAIYGWASRPTRRLVERNPLAGIELPPNDEKPRTRVADADEASALIAALDPADAVPYALAFYAGLRRAEIKRLDWPDVELDDYRLVVRKAKSRAGTGRRPQSSVRTEADPAGPRSR